jgi:hypothetical protein
MKVFLSWSGDKSHKIAIIFRDWLPCVIQSIESYVSSEDIDKGARWSTDIAKELENSSFGILCVTRENINAPWLNFEAGALSKTIEKSSVSPFLFDIKRSEINGPILQFQSTIFEKDDIKKLIFSLNKACENGKLLDDRLEDTFNVWYPKLEEYLKKVHDIQDEQNTTDEKHGVKESTILEEILELTRINQKLIRNPEGVFVDTVSKIEEALKLIQKKITREFESNNRKKNYKHIHPMMLDEFIHSIEFNKTNNYIGFQIILSFFRDDFPWIYDAGKELIDLLKSSKTKKEKMMACEEFQQILELSFEHPMLRELNIDNKDMMLMHRDIPRFLMKSIERMIGDNQ